MSARELVVLGTASQVPTRTRNHVSAFLRFDDLGLLLDCGEGTQRQLLHAGVPASRIDRVCITHAHGDHCMGLPGVLSRILPDGLTGPVPLHCPASAVPRLEALTGFALASGGLEVDWQPADEDGRQPAAQGRAGGSRPCRSCTGCPPSATAWWRRTACGCCRSG